MSILPEDAHMLPPAHRFGNKRRLRRRCSCRGDQGGNHGQRPLASSSFLPEAWYINQTTGVSLDFPEAKSLTTENTRIRRYRSQSLQLLQTAFLELRQGRWSRSEELLWGSLTLAVKGAALSRGDVLQDQEEIQAYAMALGRERRDRRIREAFTQLSSFSEAADRVRDSRYRVDRLTMMLEDLSAAVEQLWAMAEPDDPGNDPNV